MKSPVKALATVFLVLAFFVSCTKESINIDTPTGMSVLTAHTWRLEEVTEIVAGKAIVVYKQGSVHNTEDYSLVRQSYKHDGSVMFVDQFGNTGTDGEYELLEDGRKIKLGLGAANITGEQMVINAHQFSYTVQLSEEDAIHYKFTPVL